MLHPMVPSEEPVQFEMRGIDIFITGGDRDPIVPFSQTKELEAIFLKDGAKVDLHLVETDHSITMSEVEYVKKWLHSRI